MEFISVPAVVAIVFYGVYRIFQLFVCRKERILYIEQLQHICNPAHLCTDRVRLPELPALGPSLSFSALKWGCLLVGIGLGILVGYLITALTIPYVDDDWHRYDITGVVYGGSTLLFGGLGLLIAFIVELKLGRDRRAND